MYGKRTLASENRVSSGIDEIDVLAYADYFWSIGCIYILMLALEYI